MKVLRSHDLDRLPGLEDRSHAVGPHARFGVVEPRRERDVVQEQADRGELSTRVSTRALPSVTAMLSGMLAVSSLNRSMIGREQRTSRDEVSRSE